MLAIEGTRIMEELYPGQFTSEGKCKFTFSSGWRWRQMEMEGFSYRRTTTKKRKNLAASDSIEAITKF